MAILKPQRLSRKVIYENRWVNLYLDQLRLPDGRVLEQFHMLDFELEAVAAVVENSRGELLFVHAYRYPTDSVEWEIPAGIIEPGESILETARREVFEESGHETTDHMLMYSYYPLIGMSNKVFHIVYCRAAARTGDIDASEVASYRWIPLQRVQGMIQAGAIRDGFTLTALLLHLMR
jgi:ADP-ribose pyrophosphatase